MNFVADHQHPQDYHSTLYPQEDHNRLNQVYYPSPSPRPYGLSQSQSPLPLSPYSQSSFSHAPSTKQSLPEVGQTRCYWALLSSDLRFLVLDPVLAYHLHEQANDILNTRLLDFVHPEERASAKEDLGGVLNERTLHGSVTRVRFCRLSCVRRLLGYTPSEEAPPYPPTFPAERIAIDYNYMAIDIVLNWAAEGVVLCFLHAVVDIAPREDNDESVKTGWSNWCSTYGFDEKAHLLYTCLSDSVLPQLHYQAGRKTDPSLRVLQILKNNPERTLMISWPPDDISTHSYIAVPHAQDLGRLAQHVEIGTSGGGAGGEDGDARTSCTRRYKSCQRMPVATGNEGRVEVESIFVPHGTIIFACHKIDYVQHNQHPYNSGDLYQSSGSQGMMVDYLPAAASQHHHSYYSGGAAYDLSYMEDTSEQHSTPSYVEQWVEGQSHPHTSQSHHHQQWGHEHSSSSNSSPNDACIRAESSITSARNSPHESDWANRSGPTRALADVQVHGLPDNTSRPPGRNLRRGVPSRGTSGNSTVSTADNSRTTSTPREVYSGGGRSSGNPPVGVSQCASCRATHSPEWRKGPSGKKDLCNACGLRFARSRAKKEGVTARKRKEKEKGPVKHASLTSLSATSEGQPNVNTLTTMVQDHTMFDNSRQRVRNSPSDFSDASGTHVAVRNGANFDKLIRPYNRSESPSLTDGHIVSEVRGHTVPQAFSSDTGTTPSLMQSSNARSSFPGSNDLRGSSAHLSSRSENDEQGAYEASPSRMESPEYTRQMPIGPGEGYDQNRLLTVPGQHSSYSSSPRFVGRSSPLRTAMDI